jgi:hypothetical protein
MSGVSLWYERQFTFAFPAELYPNICIRLRGTPARMEEIARKTPRESLTRKFDEKWSPQEHAGHLLDLEPLWLKRLEDFVQGRAELSTADLSNRKTHEANHNSQPIEDVLADFRKARLRLVDRAAEVILLCIHTFWCILACRSRCGLWITFISWLNMTTIIWRAFGN